MGEEMPVPEETQVVEAEVAQVGEAVVEPPAPTAHELSVRCLSAVQQLNGQIHLVTQLEAPGSDTASLAAASKEIVKQLREAFNAREKAPQKAEEIVINVNWPPIVEGDIPALMGALVEAITLNGFEPTGIDEKTGIKAALSLVSAFANIEIDVEEIIEEMYPEATYKGLTDRTPLMKVQNEQALNPPAPVAPGGETPGIGAAPHPPQARKPHPKKIDAQVESRGAIRELRRALVALKERK